MKTIKKSRSNYVVAIPSYQRCDEITKKTLPTLKKGKVNKNKIYVFVANKTEEKLYKEKKLSKKYYDMNKKEEKGEVAVFLGHVSILKEFLKSDNNGDTS